MKTIPFALPQFLFLFFLGPTFAAEPPPNVVLIFADDLGYGDLGCYGATKLRTPQIDKLAAEGRKFTDAHSASAVCTPSRYGLLTGEYPFRAMDGKGIWGPAPVTSPLLIPTNTLTIADLFKQSGYDTAVFGKWHLGFGEGRNDWREPLRPGPQDLGFDYYFGMPVVNSAPPYVYVENDRILGSDPDDPLVLLGKGDRRKPTPITPLPPEAAQRSANRFAGAVTAHTLFNDYEVGTKLAEKATGWITSRGGKPFFLYFATTNVHHPFTPAKRFQGTSECGVYGDFVHELDWIVGEVMRTLEATGVADNTLVIFTSDNGGMFNLGGRVAAAKGHRINGDLLGSKFGVWEGGHRVPFIARWPGNIEAGSESDQLLSNIDMLATVAALTGQTLSESQRKDSVNMLPALVGNPDGPLRTEMVVTPHKPTHTGMRDGKWMYIPARSDGGFTGSKPGQHAWGGAAVTKLVGTPNSDIENGRLKPNAPPAQLYDLHADRNQTTNRFHQESEIVEAMKALLNSYREATKPNANKPGRTQGAAAPTMYDEFEPVGNIRHSFESGALDGWTVAEGELGQAVTAVPSLAKWRHAPFARHGGFHLSTLVLEDGESLSDKQTAVLKSPAFKLTGERVSFLVSGGYDEDDLHVALVDADSGNVLLNAGGARDHRMRRIVWDVSKWTGRVVRFEVVDRVEGGWGHLNVDDFSVRGEPVPDAKPESAPRESKVAKVASKPNFVVVFADDLGYGDLSCYGPSGVETPHLDKLAAEGFRSTDFFVPANVCSPSRAALLTGRYPMRCGMPVARTETPGSKYKDYGFAAAEVTIPELLKPAGYRSLMVGKWHLGMEVEGSHPIDAGFDEHLGIPSNYAKARGPNHNTLYRGKQVEQRKVACEALTKRYTDEVVRFIERRKSEPFFIYVSHHIVHSPLLPRKEFAGASRKGKYGDFIKELDHSTGRIMRAIRDAGLDDSTLVVFTSDNGPTRAGETGGLNGGKYCTMEGGHRVPGIFRWTGRIPANQVSDVTLTSMDLLPLFCGLAGVQPPADRELDGRNILPVLMGQETASPHKHLYYYNGTNLQAVREGHWKLHLPRTAADQPFWSKKRDPRKGFVTLAQPALFNLKKDVGERHNVAEQHPEIVARLQQQAESIRAELGDVRVKGTDQRPIKLTDPQER